MPRIAVTGALGQLGSELCRQLADAAIPLDLPEFDLADPTGMQRTRFDQNSRTTFAIELSSRTKTTSRVKTSLTCLSIFDGRSRSVSVMTPISCPSSSTTGKVVRWRSRNR